MWLLAVITLQIISDFLMMYPSAWNVWKTCGTSGNGRCCAWAGILEQVMALEHCCSVTFSLWLNYKYIRDDLGVYEELGIYNLLWVTFHPPERSAGSITVWLWGEVERWMRGWRQQPDSGVVRQCSSRGVAYIALPYCPGRSHLLHRLDVGPEQAHLKE